MNLLKKLWLSRHEWRDVYIEIVSACVIFVLGLVAAAIWSWVAQIYQQPVTVPLWVLLVLGASLLFWVFSIIRRLRVPAHERLYRSEIIDKIHWEWSYRGGRVVDLLPYCTKNRCGTELILTNVPQPDANGFRGTTIYCTSCNQGFGIVNALDLADHERRKIEKKIRDDSWRQSIQAA